MRRRTFLGALAAIAPFGQKSFFGGEAHAASRGAADQGASSKEPMLDLSQSRSLDLQSVGPASLIESMGFAAAAYTLAMRDGSMLRYREGDLRIKIDTSPQGPLPGRPALIKGGMQGDRAYAVFAGPHELSAVRSSKCNAIDDPKLERL